MTLNIRVNQPCGTRARYTSGCRCVACKAANAAYQAERRLAPKDGVVVPVDACKRHIERLRRGGAGVSSIAEAAEVPDTTIYRIAYGIKKGIRRSTEAKILSVCAETLADNACVPAKPTMVLLAKMRDMGFTIVHISRLLGYSGRARSLSIGSRGRVKVRLRTAYKVKQLWRRIEAGQVLPERQYGGESKPKQVVQYESSSHERVWLRSQLEAGIPAAWLNRRAGHLISRLTKQKLMRPDILLSLRRVRDEVDAMTIAERQAKWPGYNLKRQPGSRGSEDV